MNKIGLLLCVVLLAGCLHKNQVPEDPCNKAPKVCWGKQGVTVNAVAPCNELVACYDWQLLAL